MRLFDSILIADWSAASRPVTGENSIWLGLARSGGGVEAWNPSTRAEAEATIRALVAAELAAGRRVLAAFDFPFGYPAGVAAHLTGRAEGLALWDWLAERIADGPDNANNRYAVAEEVNRRFAGIGPFWGRPAGWDFPDIPEGGLVRDGAGQPPERRLADGRAKGAKTVWQLAYAGSVGSQVLLGLPVVRRLRAAFPQARVWPFETGLAAPEAPVVLAEVYPSLVPLPAGPGVKDERQVRATAAALARLDATGALAPLFAGPPDLTAEERLRVEREEAWILGLGFEERFRAAPDLSLVPAPTAPAPRAPPRPLRYLKDPAAIYAESFRIVAEEARLDRFPAPLRDAVARIVHACGMPEVADRLVFSPEAGAAGRAALAAGAPVLCDCEMVASGLIRRRLGGSEVVVTLNDPGVPARAAASGTTRSAAAVDLWQERIAGAVVAIGNAPTALFHLLERLDAGWPRPALILGFPVGFVGAAEAKAELARDPRGVPFLTLRGRRGGSAMAAAAVNALAPGEAA